MRIVLMMAAAGLCGLLVACGEEPAGPTPAAPAAVKPAAVKPAADMPAATMPASTQAVIRCPLCKMKVTPSATALKADHAGHTYYFCSEHCKTSFEKDPAKYLDK